MEEKQRLFPGFFGANMTFFITALVFIGVSTLLQIFNAGPYVSIFVTQYIVLLVPVLGYLLLKGINIKETLRLKPLSFKNGILCFWIMIVSQPIAIFFNLIALIILSRFGNLLESPIPTAQNTFEFILGLLLIAVSAGICEEIFFRGFMFRAYERLGTKRAMVYTGFLFAIFHFDLQRLIGVFFLGLLFAYLVHRTQSIFSAVIAHTVNNGVSVTLMFLSNISSKMLENVNPDALEATAGTESLLQGLIVFGVIAFIAAIVLMKLLKRLRTNTVDIVAKAEESYLPNDQYHKISHREKVVATIPIILVIGMFIFFSFFQIMQIIKNVG